ncbi:MAG TPA: XRE family transcriptional regulator [Rudaea sp.]|jgi:predicted XRE-type DNA-binding protein|uniref:helix-turn-helix domain-containing protein n=1 Tax=Rudaea sp. TaxID=2136325 RepID=UPI002F95A17C
MNRKAKPSKVDLKRTSGDPRGVFHDLFDPDEAAELTMRAEALRGLQAWLVETGLTQAAAASQLGVTQARVSDIKRRKIGSFSLDLLVRLAARAGLRPQLRLAA